MSNETFVYIPFLVFHEDKLYFTYHNWDAKDYQGSVTHSISQAFMTTIEAYAHKAFNKTLRGLAPKKIWDHHGFLKIKLHDHYKVITYLEAIQRDNRISYRDVLYYNLIEVIDDLSIKEVTQQTIDVEPSLLLEIDETTSWQSFSDGRRLTHDRVIEQLKSLIENSKSFIDEEDSPDIWTDDIMALKMAIQIVEEDKIRITRGDI